MTILIAGTIEITNGKRGQAIIDATSVMIDIRPQTGCNHYVWSADPTSDTRVYVFEDWDNTAALAALTLQKCLPYWPILMRMILACKNIR